MTHGSCIGIHIAVTAILAGVGSVTLLCTGRCRHNILVTVSGGCNRPCLRMITALTVPLFLTVSGTGGSLANIPGTIAVSGGTPPVRHSIRHVTAAALRRLRSVFRTGCVTVTDVVGKVMAQSRHIGIGIGIAAVLTGVGCITLLRAGRCRNNTGIAVHKHRNHTGLELIAPLAVPTLLTGCLQGCFLCHIPVAVTMAQRGNIGVRIAVAAVAAGMGSVATIGTGGRGNLCHIVMSGSLDHTGFEVSAISAVPLLLTVSGTGGSLANIPGTVAVAQCGDVGIHVDMSTIGACMGSIATIGTGGHSDSRNVIVPGCGDYPCFKVGTVSAFPFFFTGSSTGGGLRHTPLPVAVALGRNIAAHIGVTAAAGMRCITLLCAGGFGNNCLIIMDMINCGQCHGVSHAAHGARVQTGASFGFRGLPGHNAIIPGMTQCRHIAVCVAVAAVTGVSSITLIYAGRRNDNSVIRVAGSRNSTLLKMVTIIAIPLLHTINCAGSFLHSVPGAEDMAGGGCIGIHIAFTTCTNMGCIPLVCAGRWGYNGCIGMARSLNHTALEAAAVLTVPLFLTVSGTGGSLANIPGTIAVSGGTPPVRHSIRHVTAAALRRLRSVFRTGCVTVTDVVGKVMAQSRHIGIGIGIAAVLTGVGCITLLRAGRCRNNTGIAVHKHRNHTGLELIAPLAVPTLLTGCLQGCFLCHIPVAVTMAQRGNIGVRIAVAAVAAGMGSVATIGTGGCANLFCIIVANGLNYTDFMDVAVLTIAFLFSIRDAARSLGSIPVAERMAGGRNKGILIAVSAVAGMGGITLPGTAGSRYHSFIGMSGGRNPTCLKIIAIQTVPLFLAAGCTGCGSNRIPLTAGMAGSGNVGIHVAVTAMAGMGGIALLGAAGSRYHRLISMTGSRCCTGFKVAAILAVPSLLTAVSAGSRLRHIPVSIAVSQCGNIGIHIGIAAMAGMGGITLIGTGGLRHSSRIFVALGRDIPGLEMVTVHTVPLIKTCFLTGRLRDRIPVAVAVASSRNLDRIAVKFRPVPILAHKTANPAQLVCDIAGFGTGSILCGNGIHFPMFAIKRHDTGSGHPAVFRSCGNGYNTTGMLTGNQSAIRAHIHNFGITAGPGNTLIGCVLRKNSSCQGHPIRSVAQSKRIRVQGNTRNRDSHTNTGRMYTVRRVFKIPVIQPGVFQCNGIFTGFSVFIHHTAEACQRDRSAGQIRIGTVTAEEQRPLIHIDFIKSQFLRGDYLQTAGNKPQVFRQANSGLKGSHGGNQVNGY